VNSVRGQGSRLIDRVSGSSQPGASPVVPNSFSCGGEGGHSGNYYGCKARSLLTKTEVKSLFFIGFKTMDATHNDDNVLLRYVQSTVDNVCYVGNKP